MPRGTKVSKKKRHVERPDVREKLLDAAETIVREEGYAAATARRISNRAGLKHQAVFYYFDTQDELMLALLRRAAAAYHHHLTEALNSERPVRALWEVVSDADSTKLGLEFMAMAYHNEAIRAQIASNTVKSREIEAEAIARHLKERGIEPRLSPQLVSVLTNALARLLIQEGTLGILAGHEEAETLVDQSLSAFEAWGEVDSEVASIVDAMSSPTTPVQAKPAKTPKRTKTAKPSRRNNTRKRTKTAQ